MKRMFCVLLICLLLTGCTTQNKVQQTVFAMDTVMDLQVWGREADAAMPQLKALIGKMESTWSATLGNSVPECLNRGQTVTLTDSQKHFLEQVELLSKRTGSAFDPRLRSLSFAWGFFHEENRFEDFVLPTEKQIMAAIAEQKWDLGAVVKGYTGQQAAALLAQMDVDRAILNLGGNIQTFGSKPDGTPWQIGIQDPDGDGNVGILSIAGTMAVVTSGDYQRYFERDGKRYHHILDPVTGYPAESGLRSVTVICRDGVVADALSTALFVMGAEKGAEFWQTSDDFEAVFLLTDGRILATEGVKLSGCEYEVICREE